MDLLFQIPEIRNDIFEEIDWAPGPWPRSFYSEIYYCSRVMIGYCRDWRQQKSSHMRWAIRRGFLECLTRSEIRYARDVDDFNVTYNPRSARLVTDPTYIKANTFLQNGGPDSLRWRYRMLDIELPKKYRIFGMCPEQIRVSQIDRRDLVLAINYNHYPIETAARYRECTAASWEPLGVYNSDFTDEQILALRDLYDSEDLMSWAIGENREALLRAVWNSKTMHSMILSQAARAGTGMLRCVIELIPKSDVSSIMLADFYCGDWDLEKVRLMSEITGNILTFGEYSGSAHSDSKEIRASLPTRDAKIVFCKISLQDLKIFCDNNCNVLLSDLTNVPPSEREYIIEHNLALSNCETVRHIPPEKEYQLYL